MESTKNSTNQLSIGESEQPIRLPRNFENLRTQSMKDLSFVTIQLGELGYPKERIYNLIKSSRVDI